MITHKRYSTRKNHQRGAVLFLAMIFLVLLTVLAITASSTSIMQERMTGGLRNNQLGLMGAESTLRGGEGFLWNLAFDFRQPLPPCLEGATSGNDCVFYPTRNGTLENTVQAFRTTRDWISPATDGARTYGQTLTGLSGSSITANLASNPRFMIEYLGPSSLPPFRGGGAKNAQGTTARVGEHHLYRITARSQGGSDAVVRVAESYYSAMNLTNSNFNPGSATP